MTDTANLTTSTVLNGDELVTRTITHVYEHQSRLGFTVTVEYTCPDWPKESNHEVQFVLQTGRDRMGYRTICFRQEPSNRWLRIDQPDRFGPELTEEYARRFALDLPTT